MELLPGYEDLCQVIHVSLPDQNVHGLGCVHAQSGMPLDQVGHVPGPGSDHLWSRLGMSMVLVGPVPGPGWACPWSRLAMSLVQVGMFFVHVGRVPGSDWARPRAQESKPLFLTPRPIGVAF